MTIGLKNLVMAVVESDDESGTVYKEVELLAGAIDVNVSPESSDADIQYADDVEFDSITPDVDYSISAETAGFPVATMAKLNGHKLDSEGGMIIRAGDEPPYVALGFMSEKSKKAGGGYRYVWLYKCKPALMETTYHTKEGKSITRQTGKVTFRGVSRISDGLKQYVVDKAITDFFDEPYTPTLPANP